MARKKTDSIDKISHTEYLRKSLRSASRLSSKYLHLAILLGYIAVDHGADPESIDGLIRQTSKEEIDRLLLEQIKRRSNDT